MDLSGLKHFKTTEVDLSNSVNLDKNKNPDFRENLIYLCLFEFEIVKPLRKEMMLFTRSITMI